MKAASDPQRARHPAGIRARHEQARRGVLLVVVLVVITMLSLAGFAFNQEMYTAHRGSRVDGVRLQAEALAQSAATVIANDLSLGAETLTAVGGAYDNPQRYQGAAVYSDETTGERGRFTILTPEGELPGGLRFGVADESARLNLAALLSWEERQDFSATSPAGDSTSAESRGGSVARDALLNLPGMTVETADSLLDWIDTDNQPREFGAEVDYYAGLDPPYGPRNGAVDSPAELQLVQGVTPQSLFGTDFDRNGRPEPGPLESLVAQQWEATEMSAAAPVPDDGFPAGGWSDLITHSSAERNVDPQGQPRINLNGPDLRAVHAALAERYSKPIADFVVLVRQFGPSTSSVAAHETPAGNIDWSRPAEFTMATPLAVVGLRVDALFQGASESRTVSSPYTAEPAQMQSWLFEWLDGVTCHAEAVILGRINVNLARPEILAAVPGLSPAVAETIAAQRGTPNIPPPPERRHAAWLLAEGLVDLETMQQLFDYLTAAGDIYRAQLVGHFDEAAYQSRVEVVIDATSQPPQIVEWMPLTRWGRVYPSEVLETTERRR